jgi:hypothetical protein
MKLATNVQKSLICIALVVIGAGGYLQFQKYLSFDPNTPDASADSGAHTSVLPIITEGDETVFLAVVAS